MATIPANTYNFKLCFSTWACPEWTAAAIVDGMQTYGYEGVELCVGEGHQHGVELDATPDVLLDVRKQFDDAELAVACISTPYQFTSPDEAERQSNLDELKQCLRMCEQLGAPYVRVYGGEIPAECEITGVVDFVAEALSDIADFAEQEKLRARILLQTQGLFSHAKYVTEVMSQVWSSRVGVLWDVLEPLRVLEKVENTYDAICDHVKHVHIHDYQFNDERTEITPAKLGEGFVPMERIVDLLKSAAYRGYLSVEAEDQEVDPDEMLPECSDFLKNLISGKEEE